MTQLIALTIAIPFAIASYIPLFTSASSSGLARKLADREAQTRSKLIDGAINRLREIQIQLEEFFARREEDNDPFFIAARPRDLKKPVAEYLRLISLQDKMRDSLKAVVRLSRLAYWFLVAFAALMSLAVVLGALAQIIGIVWVTWTLVIAAVVFVVGGSLYLLVLHNARKVDKAHGAALLLGLDAEGDDYF